MSGPHSTQKHPKLMEHLVTYPLLSATTLGVT